MTDSLHKFGRRYRRFLRCFDYFVAASPKCLYPLARKSFGRWLNPFNGQADKICGAMHSVFPAIDVKAFWRAWRDSHAAFMLDFMSYPRLDQAWLERCVRIESPELLASLKASGGLLLTYHTHHQNTLCCALGLSGCPVSAVAAAPEDSPLFSLIGPWARRVNASSARHFMGGAYFFTNDLRQLARNVRAALSAKQALVCLVDVDSPRGSEAGLPLMGRMIHPPTGVIELALRRHAPVYAAIFAPSDGKLTLKLRLLDPTLGIQALLADYLGFLEAAVQLNPALWQGWEWFGNLSLVENVHE